MAPITLDSDARSLRKNVGETIRALRVAKGISQEKFAELSGLHRTYIGFLERGERTPNIATLKRVADALHLKASQILLEAGF